MATAMPEYTPPIELAAGRFALDTTPDPEGDLEIATFLDPVHGQSELTDYLKPADQIALRDLLNRLHPPEPIRIMPWDRRCMRGVLMAKQPEITVTVAGATQAVAAVLALHKPSTRHHEKYNDAGTLITYTTTEDGPCVACSPDLAPTHCQDCEDDLCTGHGWRRAPWPCATYTAVTTALQKAGKPKPLPCTERHGHPDPAYMCTAQEGHK